MRPSATILLVEDEPFIRELASFALQGAGYRVHTAADGDSALQAAESVQPDVIVLDIRLPGLDGWEVCRQLRLRDDVPILFVTALAEEDNVVRGLRLGADDYLAKPFSPAVLVARVDALLRRSRRQTASTLLQVADLTIDVSRGEVRRDGMVLHLTATEFRLLAELARRAGQVVSPRELVRAAQGYDLMGREALDILKVHVRNLRHKIEPFPSRPRYVLNVRGLGYMLNADPADAREREAV